MDCVSVGRMVENIMNQNRNKIFVDDVTLVYCIQESSRQSHTGLKAIKKTVKIGIASKSVKKDILSERLRALQQGNPDILEVKTYRELPTREDARKVESTLHQYMTKNGAPSLHSITETTGHKEWFVLDNIQDPDAFIEDAFYYVLKHWKQSRPPVIVDSDLFKM